MTIAKIALMAALVLMPAASGGGAVSGSLAWSSPVCPDPAHTLDGVYHPARLHVIESCARMSGVVEVVRHEEDGDIHLGVLPDPAYEFAVNAHNDEYQHGDMVVELMARDGGHLPIPPVGVRVYLTGAYVLDDDHGWMEIHPVWRETFGGHSYVSGPQFGGSEPDDNYATADEDCIDQNGNACVGY